jgi:site-specific recombinase XerD
MISVSFYLLTPKAISQSQVYISISNKEKRLRFASGQSFITSYCNVRKKKGTKDLVKKNTEFYFDYTSQLRTIRDGLIRIEMDLSKAGQKPQLEQIRDTYYLQTGKASPAPLITLDLAYKQFINENQTLWSAATLTKINSTLQHLKDFEEIFGQIELEKFDTDLLNKIKIEYFVAQKKFSNPTSNKYISIIKQFLKYSLRKGIIANNIDLSEVKNLEKIQSFKIALKLHEVETLMNLDLSKDLRLDKVRDLFCLEIFTGQRFGDIPKLLDKNNISETNITIYQQKTNEKVFIPLHPKLKNHLAYIFNKYPDGLPIISNQKFNEYLKEICIKAEFNAKHSWVTLSGVKKIKHSDFRYNLISSHSGRRTFCTLALSSGINSETIMKVTGHKKYEVFRDYVKIDDADLEMAFDGMFETKKIIE